MHTANLFPSHHANSITTTFSPQNKSQIFLTHNPINSPSYILVCLDYLAVTDRLVLSKYVTHSINSPLTSTWPPMNSDVGLEEREILTELSLCYSIV